jgi:VIT1/CCC1 family predicted Fe2+/Mn2+ transporter
MVREELGLNPEELGSPPRVAASSFASFAAGALVPLVPYLLGSGTAAFVGAIVAAGVALFAVGAGISLLTGRGVVRSGLRQVLVGALAAAITFAVGRLVGVSVS